MFDIGSSELLLIVIVAVVVIGPKDLPRALYKVGQIVGKARDMARHFRTGIDAMVREVELEDLEKKWAEQNRRIMAEHPPEATAEPEPLALPEQTQPAETSAPAEGKPAFVARSASPRLEAPAPDDAPERKGDAAA